jgi:hypothetical protein
MQEKLLMNQRMSMSPRSNKSTGKTRKEKQKLNFNEYLGPLKSHDAGRDQRKAILKAFNETNPYPKTDTPTHPTELPPRNSTCQKPHKRPPAARKRDAESLADSIKGNFTMSNFRLLGQPSPAPPNNFSSPVNGRRSKHQNFSVDVNQIPREADGSSTTGIAGFKEKFQTYARRKGIDTAIQPNDPSEGSRSPGKRRPTFSKLHDWADTNKSKIPGRKRMHKYNLSTLGPMTSRNLNGETFYHESATAIPEKARTSKSQGPNIDFNNSLMQTGQYNEDSMLTNSQYYQATN